MGVSRKVKIKVSRVFQECLVFAILLLHESHRSYPSRRSPCFYKITVERKQKMSTPLVCLVHSQIFGWGNPILAPNFFLKPKKKSPPDPQ